jgi:outer membrane protein OmpA-like peptidoglycan-associated protein
LQERLRELNAKPSPQGIMLTLGDVLFDTDKAQLKPAGLHLVHQLAAVLNEYPLHHARVEGFTDSTGSEAHNLTLSGQRAESVRLALMSQGVASARITARGHGESNPIAGNDSADGRAINRRVEIILSTGLGLISVDLAR